MKQVIKMSVDIELELDCGDMSELDFEEINATLGYKAFDNKGELTQEGFKKEKENYIDGVTKELESLDYKVLKIHNFDLRFNQ